MNLFNSKPKRRHEEDDLQAWCIEYYDRIYPNRRIFAIPNGGKRISFTNKFGRRFSPEAQRLRRQGVKKGVLDLFIPEPCGQYHGLFIEMKSSKGTTSPEQRKWIEDLLVRGYLCAVVRTQEAFIELIKKYFSLGGYHAEKNNL